MWGPGEPTPKQLFATPARSMAHMVAILAADMTLPIIVTHSEGDFVIVDGVYRLLYAVHCKLEHVSICYVPLSILAGCEIGRNDC